MRRACKTISATLLSLLTCSVVSASEVEVLHWWTSAGEKQALDVLKDHVTKSEMQWIDFAITGGGGDNAYNVLKSRIISGNPPTAAQIKGPTLQQWGKLGLLSGIDIEETKGWDKVIPMTLRADMKVDGQYVAAPINIHRNWMWVNPDAFKKIGKPVPSTWAEFLDDAPLLKKQGIELLAIGREDWQFGTLFETVVLGTAGAGFYRRALVDLDSKALDSYQMIAVFKTLSSIRSLLPKTEADQRWDAATGRLMQGKAAIQITGDWVKGEIKSAGKQPGKDILCLPAPGTDKAFIYTVDSMVMFNSPGREQHQKQARLAKVLMNPEFQKKFSYFKGSIPVRSDIDLSEFDSCARSSHIAFADSEKNYTLVPSMAHSMAVDERIKQSFFKVIEYFFTHPEITPEQASEQLKIAVMASH